MSGQTRNNHYIYQMHTRKPENKNNNQDLERDLSLSKEKAYKQIGRSPKVTPNRRRSNEKYMRSPVTSGGNEQENERAKLQKSI